MHLTDEHCRGVCGKGILDSNEECDTPGAPIEPFECSIYNPYAFGTGTIRCGADCRADYSDCKEPVCGNGIAETAQEECDGADRRGRAARAVPLFLSAV